MNTQDFYQKWINQAQTLYPSTKPLFKTHSHILKSFSPFQIKIPSSSIKQIQELISQIYLWSRQPQQSPPNNITAFKPKNFSVLMGYDFHLDSEFQPKLIEINTNASGFLILDLIQKTHNHPSKALELLKESFFEEWNLFSSQKNPHVALIDSDIKNQKMNFEFVMYKDLFESWGWTCDILDIQQVQADKNHFLFSPSKKRIDFIYNRLTDFYLSDFPLLQNAYLKQTACLSPNPREYFLLADKKNLPLLSQSSLKEDLKKMIPHTTFINESSWENKKNLFFKPFLGYGGKLSYRGKSITHKKFLELKEKGLAQEYTPASTWENPSTQTKWKYDLRVYTYKDQIQLFGGRLYQGQVTNFQTEHGGFCQILT